jgi:hypothetical protein
MTAVAAFGFTFVLCWQSCFILNRAIQINHQPDATIFQFIILTFIYSSTSFGRFPAHHQELNDCSGSLWFYFRIVVTDVLCSWSARYNRPDHEHRTTAVIELLMICGKKPETFWAVNKRQDNKLENCCIWLVIYLNCTTTNTARLSPRYEGKTRGCHCSHWAPDDGRENARNILSCK